MVPQLTYPTPNLILTYADSCNCLVYTGLSPALVLVLTKGKVLQGRVHSSAARQIPIRDISFN